MIRIDVSRKQLLEAIEAESPGWRADAKQRTRAAKHAGGVENGEGTWSRIKAVYIRLQAHKCIYCETPMAKTVSGSAEKVAVDYDVEHFRPKNRVTHWPTDKDLARRRKLDYADRVVDGVADGYVRFAFDPFNYVVSCKVCNSQYKADRFPLAGKPQRRLVDRAELDKREQPLLLFPFGDQGDEPNRFFSFVGPIVYSKPKRGHDHLRARVVIDFFELDTREDLLELRCFMLVMLFPQLRERDTASSAAKRHAAAAFVDTVYETRFPHAACARSFVELYATDPAEAEQLYDAARSYCQTKNLAVLAAMSPGR